MGDAATLTTSIYRDTSLGKALVESLDELVKKGKLESADALKVLEEYDRVSRRRPSARPLAPTPWRRVAPPAPAPSSGPLARLPGLPSIRPR